MLPYSSAFVLDTTAIILKLKRIIKDGILAGKAEREVYKQLTVEIEKYSKNIKNVGLRQQFEVSLALNCKKWYSQTYAEIHSIADGLGGLAGLYFLLHKDTYSGQNPAPTAFEDFTEEQTRHFYPKGRQQIEDLRKKVKKQLGQVINRLADSGAKGPDGVQLRSKAEMYVRHEAQQNSIEQMRKQGVRFVWASTHADSSERCSHWQGKLYSLDGTSGVWQGYSFVPIEVAKHGIKGDDNGLLGYNCRHKLFAWVENSQPPKTYSQAEMVRQRKLDVQQRNSELAIRKVKGRGHLLRGDDNQQSGKLFAKARDMTEKYRKFCEENNRIALMFRTQVTREEQSYAKNR